MFFPPSWRFFEHFLFLTKEKCRSGEWQKNTDLSIKIGTVRDDVKELWDRTGIMHGLGGKEGLRRISNLITSCKNLFKVPKLRRQAGFASELQVLFDVAVSSTRTLKPVLVIVRIKFLVYGKHSSQTKGVPGD